MIATVAADAAMEASHDLILDAIVALFGIAMASPVFLAIVQRKANAVFRERLDDIHEKVNGTLLQRIKGELAATHAALSAYRQVVDYKSANNIPILPETVRTIDALTAQAAALEADIAQREAGPEVALPHVPGN